ncbi:hypothetical protein HanIR_Chr07g0337111 [Helianthus annuus]|nr:hypothetical protein HanIR_Chr07g0337111 [Helianthus annuus]
MCIVLLSSLHLWVEDCFHFSSSLLKTGCVTCIILYSCASDCVLCVFHALSVCLVVSCCVVRVFQANCIVKSVLVYVVQPYLQFILLFVLYTAKMLFVCSLSVCLSFILFVWLDEMCGSCLTNSIVKIICIFVSLVCYLW